MSITQMSDYSFKVPQISSVWFTVNQFMCFLNVFYNVLHNAVMQVCVTKSFLTCGSVLSLCTSLHHSNKTKYIGCK